MRILVQYPPGRTAVEDRREDGDGPLTIENAELARQISENERNEIPNLPGWRLITISDDGAVNTFDLTGFQAEIAETATSGAKG